MKKTIKAELASIARTMRAKTVRGFMARIHNYQMTELQTEDLLSLIDEFYVQVYPRSKCRKCEQRDTDGLFHQCRLSPETD